LLQAAGDAVIAGAPESSAQWYGAAARLLPDTSQHREVRVKLLSLRAQSLASAGLLSDSQQATSEALRLLPSDNVTGWVSLIVPQARTENLLGHSAEAAGRLTGALVWCGHHPAEAVALNLELAAFEAGWRGSRR
jgi:hypothetical protein